LQLPHHETEIDEAVFDGREAGIAAWEKGQFDAVAERARLHGRQAPVLLESEEVVLPAGSPFPAAQVMLAGCEKRVARDNVFAAVERRDPALGVAAQCAHGCAAPHLDAARRRSRQQRLIEDAA
jgi:hypothetical protein